MNSTVIIVTGANGGIGQAVCRGFLECDATQVYLGVRAGRAQAQNMVDQYPKQAALLDLDVTDPLSWQAAVDKVMQNCGRIDVLVNNAGKHEDSLLATMAISAWQSVIQSNLDSTFYGCQTVLPAMISQRAGRIINVASLSALLPPAGQGNYAAAKAGIIALTRSLAKEVARIGITVNAVCPGYIETEAIGPLDETRRKETLARIPMRRFGKPAEVASAIRFLASAEAGYITGSTLKIDGGIF